jgi:hypothetical protein
MKTIFALALIAAFSAITLCSPTAHAADSSTCYNIIDADARLYCLAKTRKEPSTCYSIVKPDLRSMCLAEASQ